MGFESKGNAGLSFFLVFLYVSILLMVIYFILVSDHEQSYKNFLMVSVIAGTFFLSTLYLLVSLSSRKKESINVDLARDKSLFAELYENSPVPYLRTNTKGEIVHANLAAARLMEQSYETLERADIFSAIRGEGESAGHVSRLLRLINSGTFVNDQEAILTLLSGKEKWVMLSAFPYANKTEVLLAMVDITKQKTIDTAKSEFVSLASHQLRTPISSIKWNLELLSSPKLGSLNEKQVEYVNKINRSAERMSLLIKDFLDASQLEMGTFSTTITKFDLSEFIVGLLEEFEARVAKKGLIIKQSFPELPVMIETDAHLLRMSLNNLISNAVKYTPDGREIQLSYMISDQAVHITVRDTGMGVPEAEQEKLFSKFFRANNVKASTIEGTGIGLYIVKQAIDMMGGSLQFRSKEGVGTEFVVSIPLVR